MLIVAPYQHNILMDILLEYENTMILLFSYVLTRSISRYEVINFYEKCMYNNVNINNNNYYY